jgi:bifunctional enzyme CysN/CysC
VIIDAPGHQEFIKNMVTGAAQCGGGAAADRRAGGRAGKLAAARLPARIAGHPAGRRAGEQDGPGGLFSKSGSTPIEAEYRALAQARIGLEPRCFIPICARDGDNLATRSAKMPWWQGPTVLEALDALSNSAPPKDKPLRFPDAGRVPL